MRVAELWRYPVKSMAGERLTQTELGIDGIPGDRVLYVVDAGGRILSARTKPRLLGHYATVEHGEVLIDGQPWRSPQVDAAVEVAAGSGARIVEASGSERFDILPLLVATDGAIEAFGYDHRRLRPNIVLAGVPGLAERSWEGRQIAIDDTVIALADLRARCIMTTWDPDTQRQDVQVLRHIRSAFQGTLALNASVATAGPIAIDDAVRLLEHPRPVPVPKRGRYA